MLRDMSDAAVEPSSIGLSFCYRLPSPVQFHPRRLPQLDRYKCDKSCKKNTAENEAKEGGGRGCINRGHLL